MADDDEPETADDQLDPAVEPKSAKAWLSLITKAERAFKNWQDKADNIDRLYANLDRLANTVREREFQLFWANVQVLGPSCYSRPPIPVVSPSFTDHTKLASVSAEVLERATITGFRQEDIDGKMRLIRDDLLVVARGTPWLRLEGSGDKRRVRIDIKHRKDFLHDPARNWYDVDWVAARSWLTRKEARKRFRKTSGDEYQNASYEVRKDAVTDETDNRLKAGFWELWSKSQNKVVWVSEGCEKLLDEGPPHLELEGGFPCPRPAYGSTQRSSLVPVPDMLFYKDQLEEINEFTGRLSALAESLKLRGFYPAGAGEIADAVETAMNTVDNRQILIPISNWALMGGTAAKDLIVWIPLEMVAKTIEQLIALRKQLIDDVYQIMGLSDIMRGSTVASETLGAQELKSQYGSVRIRDKQDELVRIARDITRIGAEIMAENFSGKTLLEMSQMELPTEADIAHKIRELKATFKAAMAQAKSNPQLMQMAQAEPEKANQIIEQATQAVQAEIKKLEETITIDQVMKFLRDNRVRAFTLDIETDSTIAPDENAQKQRATEYITAMTGLFQQAIPAVQMLPQAAPLLAEIIKYANSQFRAGRPLEQVVEEFTEQMKQMAAQPKPQQADPVALKAQADQAAAQEAEKQAEHTRQMEAAKTAKDGQDAQMTNAERAQALQAKEAADAQALQQKNALASTQLAAAEEARTNAAQKHTQDMEKGGLEIVLLKTKINQAEVATDNSIRTTEATAEAKAAEPAKEPA